MNVLTPDDIAIIQMALQQLIDDGEAVSKDPTIPFTAQSRKDLRDIISHGKSALSKIQVASGRALRMDPLKPGDEAEFLTKES